MGQVLVLVREEDEAGGTTNVPRVSRLLLHINPAHKGKNGSGFIY
jgi:hypothetical protein